MPRFRVSYFYLATGMEGRPDIEDFGTYEAETADEAIEMAINERYPADNMYGPNNSWSTKAFIRGCLSAIRI